MKTLQQKYRGRNPLYTANRNGADVVDIVATGGTCSEHKDFQVVLRKGKALALTSIQWDADGMAYVMAWGEKIYLKDFKANF